MLEGTHEKKRFTVTPYPECGGSSASGLLVNPALSVKRRRTVS